MPTFVIAYNTPYELAYIKKLYAQGVANGVKGLRIIEHDEALLMEPGLNPNVKAALYAPFIKDIILPCKIFLNNAFSSDKCINFGGKSSSRIYHIARVGPDFYEVEDGDHVGTDPTTLENLKEAGHRSVPAIDFCEAIHEYAGVRPNTIVSLPAFLHHSGCEKQFSSDGM